jgi:hypothetical protein
MNKETGKQDIPGMGSFPCLFKKAAYAAMNFCACTNPSNQHHSVNRSPSDSLSPAHSIRGSAISGGLLHEPVYLNQRGIGQLAGFHISSSDR